MKKVLSNVSNKQKQNVSDLNFSIKVIIRRFDFTTKEYWYFVETQNDDNYSIELIDLDHKCPIDLFEDANWAIDSEFIDPFNSFNLNYWNNINVFKFKKFK